MSGLKSVLRDLKKCRESYKKDLGLVGRKINGGLVAYLLLESQTFWEFRDFNVGVLDFDRIEINRSELCLENFKQDTLTIPSKFFSDDKIIEGQEALKEMIKEEKRGVKRMKERLADGCSKEDLELLDQLDVLRNEFSKINARVSALGMGLNILESEGLPREELVDLYTRVCKLREDSKDKLDKLEISASEARKRVYEYGEEEQDMRNAEAMVKTLKGMLV